MVFTYVERYFMLEILTMCEDFHSRCATKMSTAKRKVLKSVKKEANIQIHLSLKINLH